MFFVFLILLLVLAIWWNKWQQRDISKIPGPPTLPFFGNTFQMFGSLEHTWRFTQKCNAKYYPIYTLSRPFNVIVNLLDPDDIEIILSSKNHLRKSLFYKYLQVWLGTGLLTSTGGKWQYRRKLLTPTFHYNILQHFSSVFVEHGELLVNKFQQECDKPFTDIIPIITQFTLHAICETAMGTKLHESSEENSEYVSATDRMGKILLDRFKRPWLTFDIFYYASALKQLQISTLKILHDFSKSVIEDRKKIFAEAKVVTFDTNDGNFQTKKPFAMLDLLLSLRNQGADISDEGIREEVDTFVFEVIYVAENYFGCSNVGNFQGHDTLSSGISFALMLLANHPDIQEKVAEEIYSVMGDSNTQFSFEDIQKLRYLEVVVKECLRYYPSVASIGRITDSEIRTSSGYIIPKNTFISIEIYGLHHNPKFYPDPEKFVPERFLPENCKGRHPFAYLPFSAGPRNCIGQKFAMLELKIAIASVIRNFVLIPIDSPSSMELSLNLVTRTTNGIKIQFKKRQIKRKPS